MAARVLFPGEIFPLLSVVRVLELYLKSNLVAPAWQIGFLSFFPLEMFPLLTPIHCRSILGLWNMCFLKTILLKILLSPLFCMNDLQSQFQVSSFIKLQVWFHCSWGPWWGPAGENEDPSGAAAKMLLLWAAETVQVRSAALRRKGVLREEGLVSETAQDHNYRFSFRGFCGITCCHIGLQASLEIIIWDTGEWEKQTENKRVGRMRGKNLKEA